MVFVFGSVYVVNYVYRFAYIETALHPQDRAYLIVLCKLFDVLLQSVCQLLKTFASMFIMDIDLKFSFLVASLLGFGIRMMLVL